MPEHPWPHLAELVRQMPPDLIRQAAALCDGPFIFPPQTLTALGLPRPLVRHLSCIFRSYNSPEARQPNRPPPAQVGVSLDLLRCLADALAVPYRSQRGRMPQVQAMREGLRQHCQAVPSVRRGRVGCPIRRL